MDKPALNVLYVSHRDSLQLGGQRSMLALINNLDRSNVRPFALCPREGELAEHLRRAGCKVFIEAFVAVTPKNALRMRRLVRRLRDILRDNHIAIIHSEEERSTFYCNLAALRTNTKLIWHVRKISRRGMDSLQRRQRFDNINARLAHAIIVISEAVRARFAHKPLVDLKTHTIYNGVDCSIFRPSDNTNELRARLGLPKERFIALFAGMVSTMKGVGDIIAAWHLMALQLPDEQMPLLLLVGSDLPEDPVLEIIRQALDDDRLRQHVRRIPQQTNIHEWMQAADTLLLASHEGMEGMGRVTFEAMACATVPLVSDVDGIREAVTADTGVLVPERSPQAIAAALKQLKDDPDLLKKLRANALQRALQVFDIKQHAQSVMGLYARLIGLP